MYSDIVDLRDFYLSSLGQTVQRLLQTRLARIWPRVSGESILALGFGTPLLRPWLGQAAGLFAFMPAAQGVAYWPREGPNKACLVDNHNLPLPAASIDRVILMHALENAVEPHLLLQEVWRVLKPSGRALLFVANRRGLWAHSDRTPFGIGEPYSAQQLKTALRAQGFLVDRVWRALHLPPSSSRLLLSLADLFEQYGEKLFPGFGGLLLMEVGKQLYAPTLTKPRSLAQRLVLPLPAPVSIRPVPTGRTGG